MEKGNTIFQTRILTEIVVFAALSAVLYVLRPFTLPFGGSITLGSMVPVMWLSMRRGVYAGFTAGVIFGLLAFFVDTVLVGMGNIMATPVQAILEYPIAFGVLGLAGVVRSKSVAGALTGISLGIFVKFVLHAIAGYIFWVYVYEFPKEWGMLWPLVYNGSFLLVEFIISAILMVVLVKKKTLEYAL